MSDQRFIIEMGMGNSQYGGDHMAAAERAIMDAIRHAALPMFDALGIDPQDMRVKVTLGAPDPAALECDALAKLLPRGAATVSAVSGGMSVINPDTGAQTIIVTAAVEAFLPQQH